MERQTEQVKSTNNNTEHATEETKDRETLKRGCEFRCTGRVGSSYSTCGTRHVPRMPFS